jgi:hypothetical protein
MYVFMATFSRESRLRAGLAALFLVVALAQPTIMVAGATSAAASFGISTGKGIDACGLMNNTARAQAFWQNTPYNNIGVYIGGSAAACPTNSASFVSSLVSMGWGIMPLWVGPQAPCTSYGSRFSSDTTTAYNQGKNEAIASYNKLVSLGMSTDNTPVIYDLEAFDTSNSGCLNAAKAFIRGWTEQLHVAPAQQAGVYGSSCASGLGSYASNSPAPDFIDGADWDGITSTSNMACISAGNWTLHQRHKQYQGGHSETWNGVTVSVDSDCSNGPVYPAGDTANQGCV